VVHERRGKGLKQFVHGVAQGTHVHERAEVSTPALMLGARDVWHRKVRARVDRHVGKLLSSLRRML